MVVAKIGNGHDAPMIRSCRLSPAATGLMDRVMRVINRFAKACRRGYPRRRIRDRRFTSDLEVAFQERGGLDRFATDSHKLN
jgi:hypothetical protein